MPASPPPPLPLHDIHLPPPISWWPPAPGWWYLLGTVFLTVGVGFFLFRRYKSGALRRESLAQLQEIEEGYQDRGDPLLLVQELSILLRRIALSSQLTEQEQVAGLIGEDWLRFLDNHNTTKNPQKSTAFQQGAGRILLTAPYQNRVDTEEIEALLTLCRQWIERSPNTTL
jgi:hypothetical protein